MALPETFTQFARTAAEQLRWKKARPLVEDELLTHLCDQRDALMAGGMDETAAAAESLRLTGDPYEIGTELDRVHRPKTPKLLFALAALIALAGLAFTALVSFRDYELSYFAVHQSVALLLGTAALLAAYFLDFTLLGRFALPLALMFHAALILLGFLPIGGFWLRYIYVSTHILLRGLPPLLPLMFAVLLYALRGRRGWGVFAAFVCLAVQCMFCLRVPCLLDLGFLFLCDSALLIFCARNGWFGLGKKLETLLTTLPLAAARPDLAITAIDSTDKRIVFVRETAALLGLDNVTAVTARAEDVGAGELRGKYDCVTARAVARLNMLCEFCIPLLRVGGVFLPMKAKSGAEELAEAENAIGTLRAKLRFCEEFTIFDTESAEEPQTRMIAGIEKIGETEKIYPRNFSQIKKKPL